MTIIHKAICTNCAAVVKESSQRGVLDPFFLPDHCPECHTSKYQRHRFSNDGWTFESGYWERTNPFKLFDLKTWISNWVWIVTRKAELNVPSEEDLK